MLNFSEAMVENRQLKAELKNEKVEKKILVRSSWMLQKQSFNSSFFRLRRLTS
jgi:hypothetical protein